MSEDEIRTVDYEEIMDMCSKPGWKERQKEFFSEYLERSIVYGLTSTSIDGCVKYICQGEGSLEDCFPNIEDKE